MLETREALSAKSVCYEKKRIFFHTPYECLIDDGIGDACQQDFDNDGALDYSLDDENDQDICINNRDIQHEEFSLQKSRSVILGNMDSRSHPPPVWIVNNKVN